MCCWHKNCHYLCDDNINSNEYEESFIFTRCLLEVATNIEIKGAYTLEGNKLTMTPDVNTYKAELLSISMNGQVTDNPMVRSNIMSMLNAADFKAQFGEVENYTVNVGEALLEMNDGETATNYARISTMKK